MTYRTSDEYGIATITHAEDGTWTMKWEGPDRCIVHRELIEQFVADHNEFVVKSEPLDEYGQAKGEWSDFDLDLLAILEEVSSEGINPDKSLAAYVADIKKLLCA